MIPVFLALFAATTEIGHISEESCSRNTSESGMLSSFSLGVPSRGIEWARHKTVPLHSAPVRQLLLPHLVHVVPTVIALHLCGTHCYSAPSLLKNQTLPETLLIASFDSCSCCSSPMSCQIPPYLISAVGGQIVKYNSRQTFRLYGHNNKLKSETSYICPSQLKLDPSFSQILTSQAGIVPVQGSVSLELEQAVVCTHGQPWVGSTIA